MVNGSELVRRPKPGRPKPFSAVPSKKIGSSFHHRKDHLKNPTNWGYPWISPVRKNRSNWDATPFSGTGGFLLGSTVAVTGI